MPSRRIFRLLQQAVNLFNQTRGVSEDWGAPEVLYANLCMEQIRERMAELPAGALAIVDGGCGTGTMAIELARGGHRVTGIELHRPSVEAAERHAAEAGVTLDMRQGDLLEELRALPDAAFDAALCIGVLYTCVDFRDIVAEFARVLRPGGLLFATFRPPFYFVTALLRRGKPEEALTVARSSEGVLRLATVPCYYNWQTEEEIATLYHEHGLDVLEQRPIGVFSGTGYDGMAAVADVAALGTDAERAALHELEKAPGPIHNAGRFQLSVGRKR